MQPTRVPCEGCGTEINDRFAKCPFCGLARRAPAEIRPTSLDKGYVPPNTSSSGLDGMSQEARIAAAENPFSGRPDTPVTGAGTGLMSALLPSSNTRGWMRHVEIALTVVSFPFFVASLVGIVFLGVKRWGEIDVLSWVGGAFFGALILGIGLWMVDVPPTVTWWVLGVGFGTWSARGVLRFVAAAQRLGDYS